MLVGKAFLDGQENFVDEAGQPLRDVTELKALIDTCQQKAAAAVAAKVEAMLVQAYKSAVKTTQRDLVQAQIQTIAGDEYLQEADVEPVLLAWGKNTLQPGAPAGAPVAAEE